MSKDIERLKAVADKGSIKMYVTPGSDIVRVCFKLNGISCSCQFDPDNKGMYSVCVGNMATLSVVLNR